MPTILHISDIHRSLSDPISNVALISSLVSDHERHQTEKIPISNYDAIIVSGDIIRGVGLGCETYKEEIRAQYVVARNFLEELATIFLRGDRSRLIVVPGNHDVDWNTAFSSMKLMSHYAISESIEKLLTQNGSSFRWKWNGCCLYNIVDMELYEKRFDEYNLFVETFYGGIHLRYPLPTDKYYNLFELFGGKVVVSAFNSCFGNDCFSQRGHIPKDAVERSYLQIRGNMKQYDLRVAVWHHNIEGPPQCSDYMDIETVRHLIDRGYCMGIHGHQHRAMVTPQRISLPEEKVMVVIGAGSLCAGRSELPTGINRQYNVIEISDDFMSARVHFRELILPNSFGPRVIQQLGGRSYMDIAWNPETNHGGAVIDHNKARIAKATFDAEAALQQKEYGRAISLLENFFQDLNVFGRKIFLEALFGNRSWDFIIKYFPSPVSQDEMFKLIRAYIAKRNFDTARQCVVVLSAQANLSESDKNELLALIQAEKEIAG